MNRLITILTASTPRYIMYVLIVLALMLGSHAGLDYLVAIFGGNCIPLDTSTSICLVTDTTAA